MTFLVAFRWRTIEVVVASNRVCYSAARFPKKVEDAGNKLLPAARCAVRKGIGMKRNITALLVVVTAIVSPGIAAQQNWKESLKDNLEVVYKPSKLKKPGFFDRNVSGGRDDRIVTEEGVVLVIQKPGILAGGGSYGFIRRATIENGTLTRINRRADEGQYLFKPGDRVYVQSVHVDDDSFALRIMNADPIERVTRGNTEADQYVAHVEFKYAKNVLPTANLADLQKAVGEFLATADQATESKTIKLGQTTAEIESILGKPANVIDLGPKKTFVYPNMKVVFTDGKVSDVQ